MLALRVSINFTLGIMAGAIRLRQVRILGCLGVTPLSHGESLRICGDKAVAGHGTPKKFDTLKLAFYDRLTCLPNRFLQILINLNVCS